jgi:hypothetical protein
MDRLNAPPNKQKTIDTVVEVGNPKVLKTSNKIISDIITAKKIKIRSEKEKKDGSKTPFLATSIIPLDKKAPNKIPKLEKTMIVLREATLDPIAELRKFTESLIKPTIRSKTDNTKRITIIDG